MTDYTPTTEEVRDRWGRDLISEEWHDSWAAEFDRWLAEVERAAREDAWEKGALAGAANSEAWDGWRYAKGFPHENPYRKEASDE